MKHALFLGSLMILTSRMMFAAEPFVPPTFVKELSDLEAVQKKAQEGNKAVTFLLMEPGST